MNQASEHNENEIDTLEAAERERCRAISEYDWPALEALLHPNFMYGFLSGRLEDKTVYLAGLPSRPHGVTSTTVQIHIYGDTGVIVGEFVSTNATTGEVANSGTGLGVWLRTEAGWKALAYHSTRVGPAPTS